MIGEALVLNWQSLKGSGRSMEAATCPMKPKAVSSIGNLLGRVAILLPCIAPIYFQGSAIAIEPSDGLIFKVLTAGSPGSAFVIGPAENGKCLLVTAYHVVAINAASEPITFVSSRTTFNLYRSNFLFDDGLDVAFAQIPACNDSVNLPLAKASAITISTRVLIKGYPAQEDSSDQENSRLTTVAGRVTQFTDETGYDLSYDAATKPGMSGGPVFNSDGSELVAIHGRTDAIKDGNNVETREKLRVGGRGISAPLIYRLMKHEGFVMPRSNKMACLTGVC